MSRNDIRLRRQRLSGSASHRFRNYGDVLERHERDAKIRKIVKVFTYFAIILIVVMLLIIVTRTAARLDSDPKNTSLRIEGMDVIPMTFSFKVIDRTP